MWRRRFSAGRITKLLADPASSEWKAFGGTILFEDLLDVWFNRVTASSRDRVGWGVLVRILRLKNCSWTRWHVKFLLHLLLSCISRHSCHVASQRRNFAPAWSFPRFSIRSPSAHLPEIPSGLGGSGLQACWLWNCDMLLAVTWRQMSVLATSIDSMGRKTFLPILRIHAQGHTRSPPSLFSHPQVGKTVFDCLSAHWVSLGNPGSLY